MSDGGDPFMAAGRCCNVWAIQLHLIDGNWYIYYTAGVNPNINNQHINVLQSGSNPMDPYTRSSTIIPDIWAIDATVANLAGSCLITNAQLGDGRYAGERGPSGAREWVRGADDIFSIVLLDGWVIPQPAHLDSGRSTLSFILDEIRRSYYHCKNGYYNPGRGGFFTSPDGSMTFIMYHASETSDVACEGTRRTFSQNVYWHTDGSPNSGDPRSASHLSPAPPGDGF
ncbi:hypothetical protein ACEPAH_5291 [Sanghuangporus vaninii]